MLPVEALRSLTLADAGSGNVAALSAASGLAVLGERCVVVADDEVALGVFELNGNAPGELLPLFSDSLPSSAAARKAAKPDLESVTVLPAFDGFPDGALFAAGSGSRPNRQRGVLLALGAKGVIDGRVRDVDLSHVYRRLQDRFADLNIEGMFVMGDELCLLQRGNTASPSNACVRFDAHAFTRWLAGGPPPRPTAIQIHDLGVLAGIPLSFTDGAALPGGGWVFSATAEDTPDSYADGVCVGSAVGEVGADGTIRRLHPLAAPFKVEGIAAVVNAAGVTLLMVTDADDRAVPATLLRAKWPP
jgi:hypothetical protein